MTIVEHGVHLPGVKAHEPSQMTEGQ